MLTDNQLFDTCFGLAHESHAGQVDKSGRSYLLHCMRVVEILRESYRIKDLRFLALGLTHDILEDNLYLSVDDVLKVTMDKAFVNDLQLLTRNKDENYLDYVRQVKLSDRARIVKLADIEDHINNGDYISESLLDRYFKAKSILHGVME